MFMQETVIIKKECHTPGVSPRTRRGASVILI